MYTNLTISRLMYFVIMKCQCSLAILLFLSVNDMKLEEICFSKLSTIKQYVIQQSMISMFNIFLDRLFKTCLQLHGDLQIIDW